MIWGAGISFVLLFVFLAWVFLRPRRDIAPYQELIIPLFGAGLAAAFIFFTAKAAMATVNVEMPNGLKLAIEGGPPIVVFLPTLLFLLWFLKRGEKPGADPDGGTHTTVRTGDHSPVQIGNGNTMQRAGDHGAIDERRVGDLHSTGPISVDQSRGLDGEEVNRIVETVLQHSREVAAAGRRPDGDTRLADNILERYEDQVRENQRLKQQHEDQVRENRTLRQQLAAALERVRTMDGRGDAKARAALLAARENGDTAKLLDLLDQEHDGNPGERLQLSREIMAIAYLRGNIDHAASAVEEILRALPNDLPALSFRGHVAKLRGQLEDAEKAYSRVLELAVASRDLVGGASAYGELGLIYHTRGDLDRAEDMHRKALEVFQQLDRKEAMANQYAGLGLVYLTRGDLDRAEEMDRKALEISRELGSREGMAKQYGNLGVIYHTRGDMDQAEEMHRKALEINQQLGRKEGVAIQYANLGNVYLARGHLGLAGEMHHKALEIDRQLGSKQGMAADYGNLGVIYQTGGHLDKAEKMHREALEINQQLGRKEGMANQCANLGIVCEMRGKRAKARDLWIKARALYAEIGIPDKVELMDEWLGTLPPTASKGEGE